MTKGQREYTKFLLNQRFGDMGTGLAFEQTPVPEQKKKPEYQRNFLENALGVNFDEEDDQGRRLSTPSSWFSGVDFGNVPNIKF